MLSVIAVGGAYPGESLDNVFVSQLSANGSGPVVPPKSICGVTSRATTVNRQYLETTKNKNPFDVLSNLLETPTDLAVKSTEQALARAGISATQVGLIVADTSTPLQTTPSEAQRVGKRFGLKIPAYDICGGGASLALHLNIVSSWKEEVLPEYVLCISSNTPTQSINYAAKQRDEAFRFGDGASTVLLSSKNKGKLEIVDSFYASDPLKSQSFVIDVYGHISYEAEASRDILDYTGQMLDQALNKNPELKKGAHWIPSPLPFESLESMGKKHGLMPNQIFSHFEKHGDSLGAAPGLVLSEQWEHFRAGDFWLLTVAGIGLGYGYLVLRVN